MAMSGGTAKLVKSTTTAGFKISLYVYYKISQSIASNKSTVSCGMYVVTPSGYDIGSWEDFNGSYVGTTSNTFDGTIPNFSGIRWLIEDETFTVEHEADGTGSATIKWKWGVNSPWGGYENPSGSFTIDLPDIPRATTPKLSASKVQMGKTITVTMSRASSSFTHTLKYTINGTTKTIASDLGTSYTWTIPKTLVQYIPDVLSSKVTITCDTYSGDTKIGSKTVSFTATVPSASEPTVSASSVRMGNEVTISTNREVSYYTHTLKLTLNGATGLIAENVKASHDWTVPNYVALIPNATSGTATITCITYNGTAEVGSKTVEITITAYSATTPVISDDTVQMGGWVTIETSRAASKYTHNLSYSIGEKSGTIATGVGTSYDWLIPASLVTEVENATSGTMTITCVTKNGTATIGTKKINVTVAVPSASKPTPADESGIMGESIRIKTNRKVSQYTHIVSYVFSGESATIATNVGSSVDWDIPLALAARIPSATSGTVTITCVTYNGNARVGTESCTFALSVPDNDETKPVFTMDFESVHSLSSAFDGLFIKGKSKVAVTFAASSEYADISTYSVKVGGVTKTGNPATSDYLTLAGQIPVVGTVTDSRGYSRTVTEYITVIPYSRPKLAVYDGESAVVCTRSLKDGTVSNSGEFVLLKTDTVYSQVVSDGVQHNFCRLHYRYKEASASDYGTDWTELTGTKLSATLAETFNLKTAYTIQVWVEDDVGEERLYTFNIKALHVPLHLGEGGRNVGLGQFCDYSELDRIDIGWKTYFNTGIGKKVIFEAADDTTGWEEGTALDTVFPDSDISLVDEYTLFLAIVSSTDGESTVNYPVPCFRSGNRIYGQFTVNIISSDNIRSYALYMTYAESSVGASALTLQRARCITHVGDGAHGSVTVLGDNGTADKQKVTALYALL